MKKRLIISLTIILFLVVITGCGKKEENKVTEPPKEIIENKSTDDNIIDLYSDDSKIVFEKDNSKLVFYYSGNKITAYHVYFDYETEKKANIAYKVLQGNEKIAKSYTKGKYLIIEYNKSEYEKLTVDSVRKTYSSLKEITK